MVSGADVSPRLGVFEPGCRLIECICDAGCAPGIFVYEHIKNNSATLQCGIPHLQDSCDCGLGNQFFCSLFGQYQSPSIDHFGVENKLSCRAQDIKSSVLYFLLRLFFLTVTVLGESGLSLIEKSYFL